MSESPTVQPAPTLGTLVRELRQAAGMTRQQLQDQINVAASTIRSFEMGRHKPAAWMLRRLMQSPAMVNLPELAEQAGLALDLEEGDTPKAGGAA
jgi:ribosome-binding protein aMBF1 (putative translation factor)